MNPRRPIAVYIIALLFSARASTAQNAGRLVTPDVIEIPEIGTIDLNQLPPELRDNIRVPGQVYDEPPEQFGDLPPATPAGPEESQQPSAVLDTGPAPPNAVVSSPPDADARAAEIRQQSEPRGPSREQIQKDMYEERAFPLKRIPDGAYERAWEHIQRMPAAPPSVTPAGDPQSWLIGPRDLLARLWNALAPLTAVAQTAVWQLIGPAPFTSTAGTSNAGIVTSITVDLKRADPQSGQRVYLGTFGGGLWKTSNGGNTWAPMPNNSPTMQIGSIAVHPTNQDVVVAGTGAIADSSNAAGVLRSINGATTWCQVGPTYGTSALGIGDIVIDNSTSTIRVWAATTAGLWYSEGVVDPSTFSGCPAADGSCSCNAAISSWVRVTGLPNRSDGSPDRVNHLFVSPWNYSNAKSILYASVTQSDVPAHNGWYKSTNRGLGSCWVQSNPTGLSSTSVVTRAAIAQVPTPPNVLGTDVLYALFTDVSTPSCGGSVTRLYKAISPEAACSTTGTVWTLLTTGAECVTGASDLRSVQVDPTTANTVAVGSFDLWRSTDAGASFQLVAISPPLHVDHDALTFDPSDHRVLFDGNDGGIWKTSDFSAPTLSWTNLNTNLANVEFYAGGLDTLNYGVSGGGTQDNGHIKGGNLPLWSQLFGGDSAKMLVDPKNSNINYATDYSGGFVTRTMDGGSDFPSIVSNPNPNCSFPTPLTSRYTPLALDPSDHDRLVAYSASAQKVYRTTNATTPNPLDVCWQSITSNPPVAGILSLAVAPSPTPPSNSIFATGTYVWRTTDASTWAESTAGLPNRPITSVAVDSSQACAQSQQPCTSTCSCTVYVTASGFDENTPGQPGHVFRSADSGLTWNNISGSTFPNIPADKVIVHPSNPNVLYVGADLGIYQGTFNGTSWTWGTFTSGFPAAAWVTDLAVHTDAGLLRAFTYGRSAWEAQAFPIPNPDLKVNTVNPVTEIQRNSQRISSGKTGQRYGVAWGDDRNGANNWHVYYRGYGYDANGAPTPLATETRIDDTSTHVVEAPSFTGHPSTTTGRYCSWFAWHDDRLGPGVKKHVYYQWACSDGSKLYVSNPRADDQATDIKATNASITYQPNLQFAIAWQADRSVGSSLHDVYARFFDSVGGFKPNPCNNNSTSSVKLNTSTLDALAPAIVSDASNNLFIAWDESDATTAKIMVSKYDSNGCQLIPPVRIDSGTGSTLRHDVALAIENVCSGNGQACTQTFDCPSGQVCAAGTVVATWWEGFNLGPETVFRRRLTGALATTLESPIQVNQPPASPAGAQRAGIPSVGTDARNNFAVAWNATVNAPDSISWSGFARSFDSAGIGVKNDFRVDVAGRAGVGAVRVARSSQTKKFVYAWRDNRAGHFDIYTRAVPSLN